MLIKLVRQLPGRTLRGWDTEQRNSVGRVKSQKTSKCHLRRAGPAGIPDGRKQSEGPERCDKGGVVVKKRGGVRK